MRKFWLIIPVVLVAVLALGVGIWIGAKHHGQPATTNNKMYHCGMHPQIIQDHPGTCPICHMELTPITSGTTEGTRVVIDPAVVQNMGIQTAVVTKGKLHKTIRTVGYLEVPETGLIDITLKVNGYIDKLYADKTGMHLHKGDPLFDLYSTDLIVAEEELIAVRKSVDALRSAAPDVRKQAEELQASARRKLQLLDIPDSEINAIAKEDHARRLITIRSPVDGHLVEKIIVNGSAVQSGMKLLRIEDHTVLWLEAQVYEGQLPLVKVGAATDAKFDSAPGNTFSGTVTFISPHMDHMNRTTNVRIELANRDLSLKPGMYASVQIHTPPIEDAVIVPGAAIIDTGLRKIALVEESKGHFSPRDVETGISGDNDQLQILSGLSPGEAVVTSGQFLLDVESRTQEALRKLQSPTQGEPATTSMPVTMPASTGVSDKVVQAYLTVAAYLQQDHPDNKPADLAALVKASGDLAEHAATPPNRQLASEVKEASAAMAGETLEKQHKSFEKVGAAILPLIDHDPPSAAIGTTLYVMNCPMEKADWLQTSGTVNNPFMPKMHECGSVTKTISLQPAK